MKFFGEDNGKHASQSPNWISGLDAFFNKMTHSAYLFRDIFEIAFFPD